MTTAVNFNSELEAIKEQGLFRELREVQGPQGPTVVIGDRALLNFCSNDYLGMANDKRLCDVMHGAIDRYGIGSGASPLVCGRSEAHQILEQRIAAESGRDRALVFTSGYAANLALVTALGPGRNGRVIEDRLNHASMIDGAILSRARLVRYRHADMASLEQVLSSSPDKKLVLTDAVFSMDGDIAPLQEVAALCTKYDGLLAVDDAHGYGVLGKQGTGTLSVFGLDQDAVPLLTVTFGKAIGVSGACVAGRSDLIEMLIQKARPYIYSTAMPPALAATITACIEFIRADEARRTHLYRLINLFKNGARQLQLPVQNSDTPIQPIIVGASDEAVRISTGLLQLGILVTAIRPPTVPANSSRLRITLTAAHTEEQVNRLLEALSVVFRKR